MIAYIGMTHLSHVDHNILIRDLVQNLSWNYPEVMNSINILLTNNEVEMLNSIVTTIW